MTGYDDTDFGLTAGFLWRASQRWSLGGFYREGPRLEIHALETTGPDDEEVPPGTIELDVRRPLRLPDVLGVGAAYRSSDGRWAVSAEWSRVNYSVIARDLRNASVGPSQVSMRDGDELRAGVEYVFIAAKPILALRFGGWLDPAHRIESPKDAEIVDRTLFQAGDDVLHLTVGLGIVFEKVQLDVGADFSDVADYASMSLVYRF